MIVSKRILLSWILINLIWIAQAQTNKMITKKLKETNEIEVFYVQSTNKQLKQGPYQLTWNWKFYKAIKQELISSSISVNRGGIMIALVKSALSGMLGVVFKCGLQCGIALGLLLVGGILWVASPPAKDPAKDVPKAGAKAGAKKSKPAAKLALRSSRAASGCGNCRC